MFDPSFLCSHLKSMPIRPYINLFTCKYPIVKVWDSISRMRIEIFFRDTHKNAQCTKYYMLRNLYFCICLFMHFYYRGYLCMLKMYNNLYICICFCCIMYKSKKTIMQFFLIKSVCTCIVRQSFDTDQFLKQP